MEHEKVGATEEVLVKVIVSGIYRTLDRYMLPNIVTGIGPRNNRIPLRKPFCTLGNSLMRWGNEKEQWGEENESVNPPLMQTWFGPSFCIGPFADYVFQRFSLKNCSSGV